VKFSVKKSDLLAVLTTVSPAIGSGSTLPVLKTIYLEADEDKLTVRATNLALYLDAGCEVEIKKPGACCVDSMLVQILPTFSDDLIVFEQQKTLKISQGKSVYRLPIIEASEFPVFPDIQDYTTVTSIQPLCEALRRCGFAVSTDASRPALQAYCLNTEKNAVAGADGFRLSLMEDVVLEGTTTSIPSQSLKTVANLLKSVTGEVELFVGDWFSVKTKNWQVAMNSLAEDYPNFMAILDNREDPTTVVTVPKDALVNKLKVASLFSKKAYDNTRPSDMKLVANSEGITLTMKVEGVVDFEEPIE